MQEQLAVVKLLCAAGADQSLTLVDEDDGPQTALDIARENEQTAIVAALEAAATAEGLAKLVAECMPEGAGGSEAAVETPRDGWFSQTRWAKDEAAS